MKNTKQPFLINVQTFSLVCRLLPPFGRVGVGFWLCVLALLPFGVQGRKKIILRMILALGMIAGQGRGFSQSVGINTNGATPNASALLDVDAAPNNNKGLLLPRLTTSERNAIVSPAQSLLIYNSTDSCYQGYIGTQWISFGCVGSGSIPPPTFPCGGTVIPIVDVLNPITGKIWMDRNLGASQVATSSTDAAAYGDLYQWGRCSDGHEKRTSGTTTTLSTSDTPGHGNFIKTSGWPEDWRNPQNNNLWQGTAGINNPCPTGYRLPTSAELDTERLSWSTNDAAGAFGSPLKLTVSGERGFSNAILSNVGSYGIYWSSTINGANADNLTFSSGIAVISNEVRAHGGPVRCIKD